MAVTVYSKPACSQCELTKKRMKDRGIPFEEVNLAEDPEALAYVKDTLGFNQAPVVVAGDDAWSGFQPREIDRIDTN